jgi:hypothetical protein
MAGADLADLGKPGIIPEWKLLYLNLPRAASGKTPMAAIAGGHRAKLGLNSRSS